MESGLAYIVDDRKWHVEGLAAMSAKQKDEIRADLRLEGVRMAEEFESNKKSRTRKALKRIREEGSSAPARRLDASPAPGDKEEEEEEEDNAAASLFHSPTTATPSPHPSQPTEPSPSRKPWTLTPTSSHPLLLSLPSPNPSSHPNSPTHLPKVFPSSYALFAHLHALGYYLTPGIRFGCHFSVYPGDPLRFHSHFLAMSAGWDEEIGLLDLVGGGRLGTGVKKGWLVGGVEGKVGEGVEGEGEEEGEEGVDEKGGKGGNGVRTFCIEWGGM